MKIHRLSMMHRYEEVPSSLVSLVLPTNSWAISSVVGDL